MSPRLSGVDSVPFELTIPQPRLYYSEGDEDSFFSWLKAIPGVVDVEGSPAGLHVTLSTPNERLTIYELIGLLTRYGIDVGVLRALVTPADAEYFMNPRAYWFEAMFRGGRDA